MLKDLISKFERAEGRSEFVIAVFCDIRNFSAFSRRREAPDIASLVKRFYANLLRDYFTEAVFAKPAGDGVLLIFNYSEKTLSAVAEHVIVNSLKVIDDFPTMFQDEPMINFEVPTKVGFGIARGTAFCLSTGKEIVDYSGQVLNLASRLNSLAKPQGIVIDGAFQSELIREDLRDQFKEDASVYIRGIFETSPARVLYTEDVCAENFTHHPIAERNWQKVVKQFSVQELKKFTFARYRIELSEGTEHPGDISVTLKWTSKTVAGYWSSCTLSKKEYVHDADGSAVLVDLDEIGATISPKKLSGTSIIALEAHYIKKMDSKEKLPGPVTPTLVKAVA